jgi:hypothetical protein
MKTRVFVTLFTLADTNGTRYAKEKREFDFPDDVNIDAAYAEIHDKFGMLGRDNRADQSGNRILAPLKYAVIHGHQRVDDRREKVVLPSERAIEQDLLDPLTLKACLKDSPRIAAKRMKGEPF